MKTRTRRIIGILFIVGAVLTGVGLQLAGTEMFHFDRQGFPTRIAFGVHWSAFVLLGLGFIGLLCLVISPRKHAPPSI